MSDAQTLVLRLPEAIDAEHSLLGGLLLGAEYADEFFPRVEKIVSAGDFGHHGHRLVFAAMESLAARAQPITVETVVSEISQTDLEKVGGPDFVALLLPCASNLVWYAEKVHDTALRRRTILKAAGIVTLGAEWHGDGASFAAEAERRLRSAA